MIIIAVINIWQLNLSAQGSNKVFSNLVLWNLLMYFLITKLAIFQESSTAGKGNKAEIHPWIAQFYCDE